MIIILQMRKQSLGKMKGGACPGSQSQDLGGLGLNPVLLNPFSLTQEPVLFTAIRHLSPNLCSSECKEGAPSRGRGKSTRLGVQRSAHLWTPPL